MKRENWIPVISGCLSGLVGSILVSEFDFSLFFVGLIGIGIGTLVAYLFSFFK
jgi:hypothetical protein